MLLLDLLTFLRQGPCLSAEQTGNQCLLLLGSWETWALPLPLELPDELFWANQVHNPSFKMTPRFHTYLGGALKNASAA